MLYRITRQPVLIIGVITALFGLLVAFGVDLTETQIGAAITFAGAVMALLHFVTTPSREVLAQVQPDGAIIAGAASTAPTGAPLVTAAGRDRLERNGLGEGQLVVPVAVDPDAP